MIHSIDDLELECHWIGPPLSVGPLPAFFYFSLSSKESLQLAPYNTPATLLSSHPIRIFSFTIPGHGEGHDKFHAIAYWAQELKKGNDILADFFEKLSRDFHRLLEKKLIDPSKIACGGLSRGAFIATHFAAREKKISTLLGFAPMTRLRDLSEFESASSHLQEKDLIHTIPHLLHLKHLRFYIGNLDTRVGTESCFQFIRTLAEEAHEKRVRSLKIEMNITSSIGHQGHGTAPETFEEGSKWLLEQLLGEK